MIKHPKHVFGISEDGASLRIVHLVRDRAEVYLNGMDLVDLDNSLYHLPEAAIPTAEPEKNSWEDNGNDNSEITLDEFDAGYTSEYKLTPWENMLNGYELAKGVLAINVNDENIIKTLDVIRRKTLFFGILWFNDQKKGGSLTPIYSKSAVRKFAKSRLSPEEYKAKEWHGSHVMLNESHNFWLHRGNNRLQKLLEDYAGKHKLHLFYQLADANDIALTDYFRIHALAEGKRTLLLYMGHDYRKAFIFEKGVWTNTLTLQISHEHPEPEIIYSKLALALDSAQLSDPDQIVICGDLASRELLDYLVKQYSRETVSLLTFPKLIINNDRAEQFDAFYFAQFALPIALAYKALHPDDGR
ncbi:MAG: hypothetical protein U1B83_03915, partial [Candidatus Cloacimonadaceae bacterium]|nr:hypothetical protein [Candidatus Cloacimonadaceae bacterium]